MISTTDMSSTQASMMIKRRRPHRTKGSDRRGLTQAWGMTS